MAERQVWSIEVLERRKGSEVLTCFNRAKVTGFIYPSFSCRRQQAWLEQSRVWPGSIAEGWVPQTGHFLCDLAVAQVQFWSLQLLRSNVSLLTGGAGAAQPQERKWKLLVIRLGFGKACASFWDHAVCATTSPIATNYL